jgi:O-antigen/teichoic acid export membrane protein
MSLKKVALNGFLWAFIEQTGGQIVNFLVNIILARMLFPNDFGVLGILYVFITIGNVLVDGGMKTSIIRKSDVTEKDYSSVFYANILFSHIIYLIIFFCAPFIADFYQNQELTMLLRVFSLTILFQAFIFVQSAILTKNFEFKKQAKMKMPSIILSSLIGLILALNNYGVWSLVWMYLTQTIFWVLSHWYYNDWRPEKKIDMDLFKKHFNFGYKITIVEIMNSITSNIYQIFIGRYYTFINVGYYTQSLSLRQFPISNFYGAISRLFLPIFSKIQNNETRLVYVYKQILSILLIVLSPILIYMAIFSEELIVLLYEEKWKLAKPFLFYLSISGIFGFISGYNISVLSIIGNSKILLKVEIINKIQRVVLIVLCLLLSFSINYFLCSILVASIINYLIVNFYVSKYLKIKCTHLILLFIKCLSFSGLSVFLSYIFFYRFNLILNPILDLSMSLLLGILFYLGLVYYFNKKLVKDIIDLLNTKPN